MLILISFFFFGVVNETEMPMMQVLFVVKLLIDLCLIWSFNLLVHARDGYDFDGYRLRVEFPRGRERGPGGAFINGPRGLNGSSGGGGGGGRSRGPPARRSQYRVVVSGLPASGSWQDLKGKMLSLFLVLRRLLLNLSFIQIINRIDKSFLS